MLIDLDQKLTVRGQDYFCIGVEPHQRRDGSWTELAALVSECCVCGEVFAFKTPRLSHRLKWLNRRCMAHRSPGRKA